MTLNVLSLFAGIGGLELGLERAGMNVVGQVEIDPYCVRVLAKHWPDVPRHDDVRTAAEWWLSQERPEVDVICGGFPCQPFSTAGLRGGLADEHGPTWMGARPFGSRPLSGGGHRPSEWSDPVDGLMEASSSGDRVANGVAVRLVAAGGNAVVPQVAEYVGGLIVEHESKRVAA